ncbi:hypothetical protein Ae201684P_011636 [Aphanomyces euteiches]|uniref:Uncharacterized protein n=1 Tax=Aphanomyces euteiches TaxID=100861 RepID=A0A6G0XWE6_9STRA|nr:hypothetical protein Ae201684_000607 [Aphanomyces euteiches]KAH9092101.1 hypothetical protein Ae201684P_011636 [Aphanomyces euteiches]
MWAYNCRGDGAKLHYTVTCHGAHPVGARMMPESSRETVKTTPKQVKRHATTPSSLTTSSSIPGRFLDDLAVVSLHRGDTLSGPRCQRPLATLR